MQKEVLRLILLSVMTQIINLQEMPGTIYNGGSGDDTAVYSGVKAN